MVPALPPEYVGVVSRAPSVEGQGLAVLRNGDRYASLEVAAYGGGHGHPDRLNLVLHADGEYWLPDFGTGSYVARDLFWYRSTLAHNAPRLDGVSQSPGDAVCDNFDRVATGPGCGGAYGELTRTLVAGPGYLLDVVELAGDRGPYARASLAPERNGVEWSRREAGSRPSLDDEFAQKVERFVARRGCRECCGLRAPALP